MLPEVYAGYLGHSLATSTDLFPYVWLFTYLKHNMQLILRSYEAVSPGEVITTPNLKKILIRWFLKPSATLLNIFKKKFWKELTAYFP
jgi:hypothetical protein